VLGLIAGTYLGVELWGRGTLAALGVSALVILLVAAVLRYGTGYDRARP
jgi:hypothetical protein